MWTLRSVSQRIFLLILALPSLATARPNIVLILADDMGFSDPGCFGGEIATPGIDRLAREGVRFTNFYNTSRCCPSRAALLTGLYPHQAGVGHMIADHGEPGYRGQIHPECPTIPELLRAAGYRTAMAGKWHVCNITITGKPQLAHQNSDPFWKTKSGWPRARGFDSFYGTIIGVDDYFDPFTLTRDDEPIARAPPRDFYYTDAITEEAIAQLRAGGEKPLFLYVAYTAPHWPLHARAEDIAKYEGKYSAGWDELRRARRAKQIELGIIEPSWPMPDREPNVAPWDQSQNHEWDAQRMAVYAAQIDRMDQGIRRILAALDETKQADNTLVVFLSDNGGCDENVQPDWFDVPVASRDGRNVKVGNDPAVMPGPQESFESYGPGWASASNTPFRRYKHFVHEGGISAPFVARWPGKIGAAASSAQVGHVIDLMPTFLAAANAPAATSEGQNLVPILSGQAAPAPRELFWEHEGNRAARRGDWKLVAEEGKPWELYDLTHDRGETRDLSRERPDLVRELSEAYEAWSKRVGVLPWSEVRRPRGKS